MPFKNKHPLYVTWQMMRDRCRNPRAKQWADYGGRGIKVCDRWAASFQSFVDDMGPRPDGYSLDRIDNDGDYEPGNCRWATRKEQQRNQRRAVYVTIEGKRYRAIELADQSGLKSDTIIKRADLGLTLAEVLSSTKRVYKPGLALGGKASRAKQQARTHCAHGHEFTPENTRFTPQGWRVCRKCHCEKTKRQGARKRALG